MKNGPLSSELYGVVVYDFFNQWGLYFISFPLSHSMILIHCLHCTISLYYYDRQFKDPV